MDPLGPNVYKAPGLDPTADILKYGDIAMNYMFMGQIYYDGANEVPKSVSLSSLAKPSNQVYFTEMYSPGIDTQSEVSQTDQYYYSGMVEAPMCWDTNLSGTDAGQVDGNIMCFWNWGTNGGVGTALGLDVNHGGETGGVIQRSASGTNTAWADGHAKKTSLGALAAGTTFQIGQDANDTHFVSSSRDKYVWDTR